jgi:hypothetical protein
MFYKIYEKEPEDRVLFEYRYLALVQRQIMQYLISGHMRGTELAQKILDEYLFRSISFRGLTLIMKMLGQSNE